MHSLESTVIVPAPDGKRIYTTIGHPKRKPQGVVLFVHGLASTELWPPMLLGSWFFRRNSFAYCRISLYDWRPGARTLMTTDLLQHAEDVDTVTRYLRSQRIGPVFAVGHSFGGLTLLASDTSRFRAMSLWDCSSFITHPPAKKLHKDRNSGATYMPVGFELLVSPRFRRGMEKFPDELSLASSIKIPTQVCYADGPEAVLVESSKRYFEHMRCPRSLEAIPRATHSFTEEGVDKILFRKTLRWFQRYR